MRKIKNGEPVFHHHECTDDRKGQVMTESELHEFTVECLMDEYKETGAHVERLHREGAFQPDFLFDSMGRTVNVAVMCGDRNYPDPSGFDGSIMAAEYEGTGRIPRLTLARYFCSTPQKPDCEEAVCGGDFCFCFYSLSLLPGEENKPLERHLSDVDLAVKYMDAWKKKNAYLIEPYLDRDFHYGSAWVYDELPCRKEYITYFDGKLRSIARTGGNLEFSLVRNRVKHDCGLMIRQGENVSLLKIHSEDGRIVSARMQEMDGAYAPFDPKDDLYQVHGDHLEAVMDASTYMNEVLRDVIGKSQLFKCARGPVSDGEQQGRTDIMALRYGQGDMSMLTQIAMGHGEGHDNLFLSNYPMMKGSDVEVTIEKVRVWDNLTEATIDCSVDDSFSFSFFAVDYYANRRMYKVGSRLTVCLAALGCRVEESPKGFSFEGQKAVDWLAKIGQEPEYDEQGNVKPVNFSLEKLVSYINTDSKCPDEAEFQSPAGEPQSSELLGVDFWKTDIHFYRSLDDDHELDAPLYFRKDMLPDLKKDTPVRGWLWMTGYVSGMNDADEAGRVPFDARADRFECFVKSIHYERGFDNLMQMMDQVPDLKIREGYEFDAFKVGDKYGSHYQTYCCREKSTLQYVPSCDPMKVWDNLMARAYDEEGQKKEPETKPHRIYSDEYYIQDMIPYSDSEEVGPAIGYFSVPFTEYGIAEAWLLNISAEFMPRFWHALYGAKEFIFSEDKLDELFGEVTEEEQLNGDVSRHQYRLDVKSQVLAVDPSTLLPRLDVADDCAVIHYSYWNDWRGLVAAKVMVVKNGEGVSFGEPVETVLVEYKCPIKF